MRLVGQREPLEQLDRARLGVLSRYAVDATWRERDVVEHGHVRKEVERLEHDAHALTHVVVVDARVADVDAVEDDLTVVDLLELVDAAQQRRLARSARADEHGDGVLGHDEVDIAQHNLGAERLKDAAQFEDRSARRWRHAHATPCAF